MERVEYQRLLDFMITSGKRLLSRQGRIPDIGISKPDLTEEDLAIERGFKEIISSFSKDHVLYAEEEHDVFRKSEHIWVVDPISGTKTFIEGKPHYGIVIAHLVDHKAVFAAIYDPSADELFTAYKGGGAFLNSEPIRVNDEAQGIVVRISSKWKDPAVTKKLDELVGDYSVEKNTFSMGVNYCSIACGRHAGIISLTKDSFPEFAGGFIVREAGGKFTNIHGHDDIDPTDRIFIGGNVKTYNSLLRIARTVVSESTP